MSGPGQVRSHATACAPAFTGNAGCWRRRLSAVSVVNVRTMAPPAVRISSVYGVMTESRRARCIVAPAGGGSSFTSIPPEPPLWLRSLRTTSRGLWRWIGAEGRASASCCSGERSSRIQSERPCVPTIRSSFQSCRSLIGTTGRLRWNDCHRAPLSTDTYIPNSVPAYNRPDRRASSRTTRTGTSAGMPLVPSAIRVHVVP